MIVERLNETSAWLKEATGRGLDHIGDVVDVEDGGLEEEKDIKEPSQLFGAETNEARFRTLLQRCEDVKGSFSHNLSATLESEQRRMRLDVADSGRKHKALDAKKEAIRADILGVDRQLRKFHVSDLKIREMIEDRLMPRVRQLEEHVASQVQTLESHKVLYTKTQADLEKVQDLYSQVMAMGEGALDEEKCIVINREEMDYYNSEGGEEPLSLALLSTSRRHCLCGLFHKRPPPP